MLSYLLKDAEHEGLILLDVIDQDCLLVSVAVPVLGLVLVVVVGVLGDDTPSLPDSRGTIVPLVVEFR